MGKSRDLLKKIWYTKGPVHAKIGIRKDRNGMDLSEAEDIKKRWQEYAEELYKKVLHDPDGVTQWCDHSPRARHPGMWSQVGLRKHHYEVSGGDGIPVELFQILKDDVVKGLHSTCQKNWKPQQWPQDWKRSVFIPVPKKSNAKEYSNKCTIAHISHTSKVMLKILPARLQQYVNRELPHVQLELEKAEEPEIKLPTSVGSSKKQESFRKHLLLLYWLCQSLWLCGSQ